MLWLILAFLGALSSSTNNLCSKKSLAHLDEYVVAFARSLFASLCLLPVLLFTGIPELTVFFWIILSVVAGLSAVATVLLMRAIKLSPLSLTIPLLSFTPLFLLVTSPLMMGEIPSSLGFVGVLFIVVGTYFLSIRDVRLGYFAPFKALMNEKGAVLVLIVAFLFSIATNLMKIGMQHSNPFFFALVFNISVSLALFPIMARKSKSALKKIRGNVKRLFVIGFLHALMDIFILNALELAFVTYVNSVKRTSIIFSTLFGYFFFHEQRIIERLLGASIMVVGIVLISFA